MQQFEILRGKCRFLKVESEGEKMSSYKRLLYNLAKKKDIGSK